MISIIGLGLIEVIVVGILIILVAVWLVNRSSLRRKINHLEEELEQVDAEREELAEENDRLKRAHADLNGKLQQVQRDNTQLRQEKAHLEAGAEQLRQDVSRLQKDKATLEQDRATLERKKVLLEQDKATLEQEKALLERRHLLLEQTRTTLEQDKALLERQQVLLEQDKAILERQNALLEQDKAGLEQARAGLEEANGQLHQELDQLRQQQAALEQEAAAAREANEDLTQKVEKLVQDHGDLRTKHNALVERWNTLITQRKAELARVETIDASVWDAPIPATAAPFRPLPERAAPIIGVLNLKGGVGKTTVTANLGGSLAGQRERVLLVDLDHQASLSSLCLVDRVLRSCADMKGMIQHYLWPGEGGASQLKRATPAPHCDLVTCASELDEVETALLGQWLLNPEKDPRFRLRALLHSPAIQEKYRYILLDCPPRFSTACINALACCDYLLIPTLLDETSLRSVPDLLKKLRKFRHPLLTPLSVLGVVANRAGPADTWDKQARIEWTNMQNCSNHEWGNDIYLFQASIPAHGDFAEAAAAHRLAVSLPGPVGDVKTAFARLAAEIKERLAQEGSRAGAEGDAESGAA